MNDTRRRTSLIPDQRALFSIASGQGGYFTVDQAKSAGYSAALLAHHAKTGRFRRVRRGLYRFQEYPVSPREDVLATWLRAGDSAVVSHESALDLLNLSDVVPRYVHVTVPRARRHLRHLPGARIHTTAEPVPPQDKVTRDGIVVTSATRSILDSAQAGAAPEQITLAIVQAVERGLASPGELKKRSSERSRRVERLIAAALT